MSLTFGTRLGPYEIVAPLGAGGMGEVYRATDSHLKRSVAIKVRPAAMAGDKDRLARFQREAEVLAALNHPNIAAIDGLEKTPDLTALVMELVEGEDLSQRIARGAMPIDEALPIATQIAEALEAPHEQGIIHREEQARGKFVDRRADIWAFWAVLFEPCRGAARSTARTRPKFYAPSCTSNRSGPTRCPSSSAAMRMKGGPFFGNHRCRTQRFRGPVPTRRPIRAPDLRALEVLDARPAGEVDASTCEQSRARQSLAGMVVREKNRCVRIRAPMRVRTPLSAGSESCQGQS